MKLKISCLIVFALLAHELGAASNDTAANTTDVKILSTTTRARPKDIETYDILCSKITINEKSLTGKCSLFPQEIFFTNMENLIQRIYKAERTQKLNYLISDLLSTSTKFFRETYSNSTDYLDALDSNQMFITKKVLKI